MSLRPILASFLLLASVPPTFSAPGDTELISVRRLDVKTLSANRGSSNPSISGSGRFVAFESLATDLVPDDTNHTSDIFVLDRTTGAIERASVASDGTQGGGDSTQPAISANGRFVAFASEAHNLVPGDTNEGADIFVHDRVTRQTTRVTQFGYPSDTAGSFDPVITPDGRYVAFASVIRTDEIDQDLGDVFVHDRRTGTTTRVSVNSNGELADEGSFDAAISADGRFVAFSSRARNLATNDTNEDLDVYVHDLQTRTTTQVSVSSAGVPAEFESFSPSITADGRFVAFESAATNLVPNDTNQSTDIFVRDRATATTTRVSVDSSGRQANKSSASPSISADGRVVVFQSLASNLIAGDTNGSNDPSVFSYDIFVHNLESGRTIRVNVGEELQQANAGSLSPAISAGGTHIAFVSSASNLVVGDENASEDIFVRDRVMSETTLASVATVFSRTGPGASDTGPLESLYFIFSPNRHVISSNGRYVAFSSRASTLVKGDTNGLTDIFVRDRMLGRTKRVSVSTSGAQAKGNGDLLSQDPFLSGDGRFVVYTSLAANLVSRDTNQTSDIFVRDLATGTTSRASLAADGTQANGGSTEPSISDDGRYVAFTSGASNLVDLGTNTSEVYVRDRQLNTTRRISVTANGGQANGASGQAQVSGSGRYIAFTSGATNLTTAGVGGCFVHDQQRGKTTLVSRDANGRPRSCSDPSISANGRFVAFHGAPDIFVRDRTLALTTQVTVIPPSCFGSEEPSISANGRFIAYSSNSDCLVSMDLNGARDVFLYDRLTATTTLVSVDSSGAPRPFDPFGRPSAHPAVSDDGDVAFASEIPDLVADDANDMADVFVHERLEGQ